MDIMNRNTALPRYVVKHELGKVYRRGDSLSYYLLIKTNNNKYAFVNLSGNYILTQEYSLLSEVDSDNKEDILIDAVLSVGE